MTGRPSAPIRQLRAFARDRRGTSAVEFVLVAPIMVALILLAINGGLMMYAGAALNFAVADAARCGVVKTTCRTGAAIDTTKTTSYAGVQYAGFSSEPVFTPEPAAACGHRVSATANYRVVLGIAAFDVPMEATACYPLQPTV